MKTIMISVTDSEKRFSYDLEIPVGLPVGKLKADMMEALNGQRDWHGLPADGTALFCARLGRTLRETETAEEAGVWNGDELIFTKERIK